MQFKVGDTVVHSRYGVGHIVNVEQKQVSEQETRLCYKISLPGRTVWIPTEADGTGLLRRVTSRNELDQYRRLLKSPPVPLAKNHHRRHLELLSRLKQGSFKVVCEVVRDLTAWGRRKPLGPTDSATLEKTRANLYQEWAAAAGLTTSEAVKEVETLLQSARQVSVG